MSRFIASLLRWVSASLLGLFLAASTGTHGTSEVKFIVEEGDSVTLPCSMPTKQNIRHGLFDWKKDDQLRGRQEIFLFDDGSYYGNGHMGQDAQYKGRVSHFEDQLQYGNASILIRNTQIDDSGNYNCSFPRLLPGKEFPIELVVVPQPSLGINSFSDGMVLLQCEVQGALHLLKLQLRTADQGVVPAEVPQVSERGGRYDVKLYAVVTKSEGHRFCCQVKHQDFDHVIQAEIHVPQKLLESKDCCIMSKVAVGLVCLVLIFVVAKPLFGVAVNATSSRKGGAGEQGNISAPEQESLHPASPSDDKSRVMVM